MPLNVPDSLHVTKEDGSHSKYWSRSPSPHSYHSTLLFRLKLVVRSVQSVPLLISSDMYITTLVSRSGYSWRLLQCFSLSLPSDVFCASLLFPFTLPVIPDILLTRWSNKCSSKVGTSAASGLHSLPHQHQCRCCPYFRFSVIRIPFPFRFLVSPPFHHLPPLRVFQLAVIAGKWSYNIYLDINCGRNGA